MIARFSHKLEHYPTTLLLNQRKFYEPPKVLEGHLCCRYWRLSWFCDVWSCLDWDEMAQLFVFILCLSLLLPQTLGQFLLSTVCGPVDDYGTFYLEYNTGLFNLDLPGLSAKLMTLSNHQYLGKRNIFYIYIDMHIQIQIVFDLL